MEMIFGEEKTIVLEAAAAIVEIEETETAVDFLELILICLPSSSSRSFAEFWKQ